MRTSQSISQGAPKRRFRSSLLFRLLNGVFVAFLLVVLIYVSLILSSHAISPEQRAAVDRAIHLLERNGFEREVFLLRNTVTFRSTDNWLNSVVAKTDAYAATNFPFQMITLYPDFSIKTVDDIERAMVLLHEAQHLQNKDEAEAYAYVWLNRARLGWTQVTHGKTSVYVTIREQTRENAPQLFTCPQAPFNDCTEPFSTR